MYNSLVFTIVTELCTYHYCLFPEHFHHLTLNPVPISTPQTVSLQLLATTDLLSVCGLACCGHFI